MLRRVKRLLLLLAAVIAAGAVLSAGCGGKATATPTPSGAPTPPGGILTLSLASNAALAQTNGSASFDFAGLGWIVVAHRGARLDASGWVTVTQTCTRDGCLVAWTGTAGGFVCPCDHAIYAADGTVVANAPAPLHAFTTAFDGTNVVIDLSS